MAELSQPMTTSSPETASVTRGASNEGEVAAGPSSRGGNYPGRRLGLWFLLSLLCLSLLVIASFLFIWTKNQVRKEVPQSLVVEPEYLNLGKVWETGDYRARVPITNVGSESIRVAGFTTSCGCLSIEPGSFQLDPGQQQLVELRINLTLSQRSEKNDFAVQLTPQLEGNITHTGWTIRGTTRRLLRLSEYQPYIRVASGDPSSETEKVIKISSLEEGLDGLEARAEPPLASVLVERLADRQVDFNLRIRPSPTISAGPFRFDVHLTPKRGSEPLPEVVLPVRGAVRGPVYALTEHYHLGLQKLGTTVTETIILRAADAKEFSIEAINFPDDDVIVKASRSDARGEMHFLLVQRIAAEGQQDRDIVFNLRLLDGTKTTVRLRVTYLGMPST